METWVVSEGAVIVKVALGQGILQAFGFPMPIIVPPMFHTHFTVAARS
jgi:hypothetical protein